MTEPAKSDISQLARRRLSLRARLSIVALAFVVLWAAIGFALGLNAFGENVSGKVTCANGPVTGVYIEAKRFPRFWGTDAEVQSGFASWTWTGKDSPRIGFMPPGGGEIEWHANGKDSAEFKYWLPYGGEYSIHFGCGLLIGGSPGAWASDNQTPFVSGSGQDWWCDSPLYWGFRTLVVKDCRSN